MDKLKIKTNINDIRLINNNVYIIYKSGYKRQVKNKYFEISLKDFLKRGYTTGCNISYYLILKNDYKDFIKNKNICFYYMFRNIIKNNKLNVLFDKNIQVRENKKIKSINCYRVLNDNINHYFKSFKNIKIEKNFLYIEF